MSDDSAVVDRKGRAFYNGNAVNQSFGDVDDDFVKRVLFLSDCPPGFENVGPCGLVHAKELSSVGISLQNSDAVDQIGDNDCDVVDFKNVAMVKSGYVASSLVWSKMRSGVWWPGQIFDTGDLSKDALREYKEGKLLVAYFGNAMYTWNDVTTLRPFQLHFEEMGNRSDVEMFCGAVESALDEVFRRVEFGLSCVCLSLNVYADIQFQKVDNLGIYKKDRRRDVRDECSSAKCFVPSKLVSYIKDVAKCPTEFVNKLELVECKAQLTSFCRLGAYHKLPEYSKFVGLPDIDAEFGILDGRAIDCHMDIANNAHHSIQLPTKSAINEGQCQHQPKRRGRPKGSLNKKKKTSHLKDCDELYIPPNQVKAKRKARVNVSNCDHKVEGLPENIYADIRSQKVENWEIRKRARRNDRDECSTSECFVPSKFVSCIKDAAKCPTEFNNKLGVVTCKAQMASICRLMGYHKLPEYSNFVGLPDINANLTILDGRANNAHHIGPLPTESGINEGQGEHQRKRRGRPKGSLNKKTKEKMSHVLDSNKMFISPNQVKGKRKARVEVSTPENKMDTHIPTSRKMKVDQIISSSDSFLNPNDEINVSGNLSPYSMFTGLASTAMDPSNCRGDVNPLVKSFSQFRNLIYLNHPIPTEPPEPHVKKANDNENVLPEHVEPYCIDQIVLDTAENKCSMEASRDELASRVAEHPTREALPIPISETVPQLHTLADPKILDASDNQESAESILDIPRNQVPEDLINETMQTALLLKFSEHYPVPSASDLNKIFSFYGPLEESETKIMKRKLAKVLFKRKHDAEAAFSSTGKYKTFGPSLVSFRLKYLTAKPKNISPQTRKRRKKTTLVDNIDAKCC